ncbi:MAG TPA: YneF family protein [Bacilli bacterium]|nr:YneF family protein [Bacilli bacterium]
MQIAIWLFVVLLVVAILVGGVVGFFISRKIMMKYLKDNPPINEKMVRAMLMQMGRTPSEKQVRQVMASMNQYK